MKQESEMSLYKMVVDVTYGYLGPAADRFVARQIKNHLSKRPERLEKKDLEDLIDWIALAVNLLSDNKELVNKYVADLRSLVNRQERG